MRLAASLSLTGLAVLLTTACGDPNRLEAVAATVTDTTVVYALSNPDINLPSAYNIPEITPVRATGAFNYDIAFNISAAGKAVFIPMALLAVDFQTGIHPVGLLKVPGTFDAVTIAPREGYVFDDSLTVDPGEVIVVQATVPRYCGFPYPQQMYAKFVVDSVKVAEKAVYFRLVVDPSCGFRSFLPGIPRE
jgi:hypothetical protein